MMPKYFAVKLPPAMKVEIDGLIEDTGLGYSSSSEFVKDATRRHIERMRGIVERHRK